MQLELLILLIPGAVLLIARQGKIADLHAVGFQDRRSRQPMLKNCIFRIASMSKPITSVGAMILAEQGKLDVAAPVEQYLPEFKGVSVGAERAAPSRPMTVQDLLRHTSGLTYGIGDSVVEKLYRESNLFASSSLAAFVQNVASLPLAHQPGAQWE
jgi:CubicO group peptidase (beta-lactamase class C family)